MALEQLQILVETRANPLEFDRANPIKAMFNPTQINIKKSANWRVVPAAERDVPAAQFTHGEPATLSIDLFFDTYESRKNVKQYTDRIDFLSKIERHGHFHRPPICQLLWGRFGVFFQGVIQNLDQRFTLFLNDGTPVRATLTCGFQEWRSDEEEERRLDRQSVDVAKRYTVRGGDSLSSIAGQEYVDPSLWRPIAEANHIDDPRGLSPGDVLVIPVLPQGATPRR